MSPLISALSEKKLDIDKTLVLNDMPDENIPAGEALVDTPSAVAMQEYSPNRVRLVVQAARPGFIFLSDTYFPGWVASINGKRVRMLRSWINFRAVQVARGSSIVEFNYRPWPLWSAVAATAATSLLWIFFYLRHLAGHLSPQRASAPAPAANSPARKKKKDAVLEPIRPAEIPNFITDGCSRLVNAIFSTLIFSNLAFWAFWSAFIYQGGLTRVVRGGGDGLWINFAAFVVIASCMGILWSSFKSSSSRAKPAI